MFTCPCHLGNPRSINIVADLCSLFASVQEMIPMEGTGIIACHLIDTSLNHRFVISMASYEVASIIYRMYCPPCHRHAWDPCLLWHPMMW